MDRSEWKSLFEDPNAEAYYNTAGSGLCPGPVKEEMKRFLDAIARSGPGAIAEYGPCRTHLRESLAAMMGADPEEVAVLQHTAEGASVIGNGIAWKPGDKILTLNGEYPSTIYPWMNLERRGLARLVVADLPAAVGVEEEIVAAIRREKPRLFALSAVEWCTGYRYDLEPIGRACEDVGAFFFVDSAQALGFSEVDVRAWRVSAMAGSAWKWLLGPWGQGYLYLRRDLLESIQPVFVGSDCVVNAGEYLDYDFTLLPDMRRFEYSTASLANIVWFDAAVRFVNELGRETIRAHVFSLQDYAFEKLGALGCELRGGGPLERRSGIMGFRHPALPSRDLSTRLAEETGIQARERAGFVRLSFHVYNSKEGVERLADALGEMSGA